MARILPLAVLLLMSSIVSCELECEDLPAEDCAFAVSSSGARCMIQNSTDGLKCQTSMLMADKRMEWIESGECMQTCGVDRMTVGMSADAFLERSFFPKLCSSSCQIGCHNIFDLYVNLAAGEDLYLPGLCQEHAVTKHVHRKMKVDPTPLIKPPDQTTPSPAPSSEVPAPVSPPPTPTQQVTAPAPAPTFQAAVPVPDQVVHAPAPRSGDEIVSVPAPAPFNIASAPAEEPVPSQVVALPPAEEPTEPVPSPGFAEEPAEPPVVAEEPAEAPVEEPVTAAEAPTYDEALTPSSYEEGAAAPYGSYEAPAQAPEASEAEEPVEAPAAAPTYEPISEAESPSFEGEAAAPQQEEPGFAESPTYARIYHAEAVPPSFYAAEEPAAETPNSYEGGSALNAPPPTFSQEEEAPEPAGYSQEAEVTAPSSSVTSHIVLAPIPYSEILPASEPEAAAPSPDLGEAPRLEDEQAGAPQALDLNTHLSD